MLSSFLVTIILGRHFSINDFGEFSLLKQLVLTCSTIALCGLNSSFTKLFSKNKKISNYIYLVASSVIFFLSFILSVVISINYNYSFNKTLIIFLIISFLSISIFLSSLYRVEGKFLIGQFIESGWKLLFLIGVVSLIFFGFSININAIYLLFFITVLISGFLILPTIIFNNNYIYEYNDIKKFLSTGLLFWIINSSGILFASIDKLAIVKIFSLEALGIYTALGFVYITTLTLIASALGYVVFPLIAKGEIVNYKKILNFSLIIIITISLFLFLFGENLTSILFNAKYDGYNNILFILSFIIIGIMKFYNIIFHFIISGKGSRHDLIEYCIYTFLLIIIFSITILLSSKFLLFNMKHFIFLVLFFWVCKLLIMIYLLIKISKKNNLSNS
tara:strand:+ start:7785 stop:8954 length:1170 start_codon:yes stop_codon:yes gene_type:complete